MLVIGLGTLFPWSGGASADVGVEYALVGLALGVGIVISRVVVIAYNMG